MQLIRFIVCSLVVLFGQILVIANDSEVSRSPRPNLDGQWLLDSALIRQQDRLDQVWSSVVSVASNGFAVSNFLDPSKKLKGKIHFDDKSLDHIDVELEELDFSSLGEPVKIEASTLKGICRIESQDAITIAVGITPTQDRPTKFESTSSVLLVRLRRAPNGFKTFPKDITIQVETADGKPVEGAIAARFQSKRTTGNEANAARKYSREKKTDSAGVVVFPYEELPRLIVDEKTRQIAYPILNPASLVDGKLNVQLAPACEVRGSIICDELSKAEQPIGWTNVYLEAHGNTVADCSSDNGQFDFLVPAGEYKLEAYGGQVSGRRVTFSVSPDQLETTIDPIELKALAFALLKGKPAPEFRDVAGWSGEPVKLSDLRGKYVLVEFWGYWCGPCVEAMPVLMELHHKYVDKGLAIVGVHVDANGEIDSSDSLREMTTKLVSGIWQGKELPFPSALVSGRIVAEGDSRLRGGTLQDYGIESFPTTILIDRNGNLVDKFPIRDLKQATERIEKLLDQHE